MSVEETLIESPRLNDKAIFKSVVDAGDYSLTKLQQGQTMRILDLEGNQAADTLFFSQEDPSERYSATDTLRAQQNIRAPFCLAVFIYA